ncbi:MAG: hypothetical protein RL006_1091 [Chloroflexota bacterium]|jgi:hypothetical protein
MTPLRVLVACEYSGVVRRAFRQLYQYAPDEDCPVDQHRLAFLIRVVNAIEAAGMAVVEMEDGR